MHNLQLNKHSEQMINNPIQQQGDDKLKNVIDGIANTFKSRASIAYSADILKFKTVLDEATSNLDADSDARIQALLRSHEFAGVTLLTIAHRLLTVIDYDRILVLGAGKLLEQGSPSELLANEEGALAAMVRALGGIDVLRQHTISGQSS